MEENFPLTIPFWLDSLVVISWDYPLLLVERRLDRELNLRPYNDNTSNLFQDSVLIANFLPFPR